MSELSSSVNSSVDQVSGTIDLVAQAARDGAVDARAAAARVLSKTGVLPSRVVYSATYTISYGVVFPVTLVAGSIPRNNAAVRGLIEGAQAASHRADAILGRSVLLTSKVLFFEQDCQTGQD